MTLKKKDIHKHTLELIYRAIKQRDAETFNCIFALSYVKEGNCSEFCYTVHRR